MTGWPVAWKCFVACLFLEESQQPTCPHVRHSRRCTHFSPVARHSSQPSELGVTGRISLTCGHVWAMTVLLLGQSYRARSLRSAFSQFFQILVHKLDVH